MRTKYKWEDLQALDLQALDLHVCLAFPSSVPSNRLISQCLCREPYLGSIEELAKRSPQDAGAAQVTHRREGERGAEVLWRSRGLVRSWSCLKVHFAVLRVWVVGSTACSIVLPQLVLEHFNLICEQRELVEGGDGAALRDLCLGNPAEKVELPDREVRREELGQQQALQVNRTREPVPNEALRWGFLLLPHLRQIRPETQHEGVPACQGVVRSKRSISHGGGQTPHRGTVVFLRDKQKRCLYLLKPLKKKFAFYCGLISSLNHQHTGLQTSRDREFTLLRLCVNVFTVPFCTQVAILPTYRGLLKRVWSLRLNCWDQSHTEGKRRAWSCPRWILLLLAKSWRDERERGRQTEG